MLTKAFTELLKLITFLTGFGYTPNSEDKTSLVDKLVAKLTVSKRKVAAVVAAATEMSLNAK